MALEDSLGRVPGLAGFLGRQQFDREQSLGQLQEASSAMTLASALKAQQEGAQIKDILANSPDLSAAIPKLAALGLNGIAVATHLTALEKARTEASMGADLQTQIRLGSGTITPAMYRSMGTKNLLSGNHAAAAPLFQEADRQEKLSQEQAALAGMKSAPAVPSIAPDVQETQQAANQGLPAPVPSASVPAQPGVVP